MTGRSSSLAVVLELALLWAAGCASPIGDVVFTIVPEDPRHEEEAFSLLP